VIDEPVRILLVSGSMRAGSSNTAVLRTLRAMTPRGAEAGLYEGCRRP
jgi:NAD(P)H-dependent FMN reductase